jgi:putative oxidoreductase
MKPLIETNQRAVDVAILLLRLMAGLILFVAGAGKVLGWFGGFGMTTTVELFKTNMQLSAFWAYLSSYTEFIGGFLIMIGLLTRFASIALLINMLVATLLVGFKNFFLGGAAYPCLLFVICLVFVLTGPLAYSIDAALSTKNEKHRINPNFSTAF